MHFQIQVSGTATARARLALSREAYWLALGDAGRDGDPYSMGLHLQRTVRLYLWSLELERPRRPSKRLLQIDINSGVMIAPGATTGAGLLCKGTTSTAAEQRREEVAIALFIEDAFGAISGALRTATASPSGAPTRATPEFETIGPIRWRPELLARLPVAAQFIVGGAFLRVLEDLVGLLDLLEMGFGVLLLAHVRMELARQAPIRLLDLIRGGRARHAQNLVVIPVFHSPRFVRFETSACLKSARYARS